MEAIIPLKTEDGDAAPVALRITKKPEGRIQACKVSGSGVPVGTAADISPDAMQLLKNLGFGQTCWLPTPEEPQMRFTGQGKMVEIRENRASAEPFFMNLEDLQSVLNQISA